MEEEREQKKKKKRDCEGRIGQVVILND